MTPQQYLLGSFEHSVDEKFRVIVPAAYRPALGNKFCLTPSLLEEERHLRLYSEVEYVQLVSKLEGKIAKLRGTQLIDNQRLLRRLYRNTASVETDAANRIIVPPKLRELASLGKRVLFVGRMSFAELWDADVFEDEINRPTPGSLLDHLGE